MKKIKIRDMVTLKGVVVDFDPEDGTICVDFGAIAPVVIWVAPNDVEQVIRTPYMPAVGERFTWGGGVAAAECLWTDGKSLLMRRDDFESPSLWPLHELSDIRPEE